MTKKKHNSIDYFKSSIDVDFCEFSEESPSDVEVYRLLTGYNTVKRNYERLNEHFILNNSDAIVLSTDEDIWASEFIDILSDLENYTSSIYSYNETVRKLFNKHNIKKSDFIFESDNDNRTKYSRSCELMYGLRVSMQHGLYNGIDYKQYVKSNIREIKFYKIILNIDKFNNYDWDRNNEPDKFLRQIQEDGNDIDVLSKIKEFNNAHKDFHIATLNVLNNNYDSDTNNMPDLDNLNLNNL